jgi:flagellar biosynthesis protein FlhB
MITSNVFLFLIGGLTFLFAFSFFKDAAMEVFKKELASNDSDVGVWSKLFKVFLVDWLVCVLGVLGTGVVFVIIFNLAH